MMVCHVSVFSIQPATGDVQLYRNINALLFQCSSCLGESLILKTKSTLQLSTSKQGGNGNHLLIGWIVDAAESLGNVGILVLTVKLLSV